MMSGGTPTEALRFLDLAGIERYSDSTITEINQTLRQPIEEECNQVFEEELQMVIGKYGLLLDLTVDFTWNAPRKGKMGTLTVLSRKSNKVLFRVHRLKTGKKRNHEVLVICNFWFFSPKQKPNLNTGQQ